MLRSIAVILLLMPTVCNATITLQGKVLDDLKKPLRGAEVLLLKIQDPVTLNLIEQLGESHSVPVARSITSGAGEFQLNAPDIGIWLVQVRAAGFVPMEMLLSPLMHSDELTPVNMLRDSGLAIRVVSVDGKPIEQALVIADDNKGPAWYQQNPWMTARRSGLTSAEGQLRLPAGSKESLTVSVTAKNYSFLEKEQVRSPFATFRLSPGLTWMLEVFGKDQKPVIGACVQFGTLKHSIGLTDDAGKIELRTLQDQKTVFTINARDERTFKGQCPKKPDPIKPNKITLSETQLFHGKVINRENTQPVSAALVWSSETNWYSVRSKSDGTFLLRLTEGTKTLHASASGFVSYENNRLQLGNDKGLYTIALSPDAQLNGLLVNSQNQPISGAEVELASRWSRHRFSMSEPTRKQISNNKGIFRFTGANPESAQLITIRAKGYSRLVLEEYFAAGSKKKELRIVLKPEIVVTGIVVDSKDQPLSGIPISIKPSVVEMTGEEMYSFSETKKIESETKADGTFLISELSPAKYDFEVGGKGYATVKKIGIEIPESRKPFDVGKIILVPGFVLAGQVLDSNKKPIEGVQIHVGSHDPWGSGYWGEDEPSAVSGVDGYFAVPDQTPGNVIDLAAKRTGYVEKDLNELHVPPPEPLSITIQSASRVSGIVVDQESQVIPEATLDLVKRTVRGSRVQTIARYEAKGRNDGTFEFQDIPPDRYTLNVRAAGWQDYEMQGVEVPQGRDLSDLRITLSEEALLEGTVMLSNGQPATDANIKTSSEELRWYRSGTSQAWSDGSGNYSLHGLKPGKANIEASHNDAQKQVKEIELKPGSNRADFQLESGFPISGKTVDESGVAVSNVSLSIYTSSNRIRAASSEDGTFLIKSAPNGEHTLSAEKNGFLSTYEGTKVNVNGAPVEGVEIIMKKGAIIRGNILGLAPEKIPLVYVDAYCQSPSAYSTTAPDYQGMYYLRGISPGKWDVTAGMSGGGQAISKSVVVEPGVPETQLDLEFSKGITLDGVVLSGESAVSNASVSASGTDIQSWSTATTGFDGNFHMEGLSKGKHNLSVSSWEEGWSHTQEIELVQDRKIVVQIPTNRVTGTVLDTQDRSPIHGAIVSLLAPGMNPDAGWTRGSTTDSNGRFEIKNANTGNWMLTAKKDGYSSANQPLTIEDNAEISGIEFLLQPTGGLTLEIRNASGTPIDSIAIAVVNSANQILSVSTYVSQGNGRFRISTIPSGTWELMLSESSYAQTSVLVTLPQTEPTKITMLPPTELRVVVPVLFQDPAVSKITLTASDGRPFRILNSWTGILRTESDVYSGETIFKTLPAGTWTVSVVHPDGRNWQSSVTTAPGTLVVATLK